MEVDVTNKATCLLFVIYSSYTKCEHRSTLASHVYIRHVANAQANRCCNSKATGLSQWRCSFLLRPYHFFFNSLPSVTQSLNLFVKDGNNCQSKIRHLQLCNTNLSFFKLKKKVRRSTTPVQRKTSFPCLLKELRIFRFEEKEECISFVLITDDPVTN